MRLLRQDLPDEEKSVKNNTLNSYFPIRTEGNKFDWDAVLGHVVKQAYDKTLVKSDMEAFKASCKQRFLDKLDEEAFWPVLEQMYFQGEALFNIVPEFLLFKTQKLKGSKVNARLGNLFVSLLQDFVFVDNPNTQLNFIEAELFTQLQSNLKGNRANSKAKTKREAPYLPFLSAFFQQDLLFLSQRPKYMLAVFKDFLRLYAHLYTCQLALNLKGWRSGEPVVKPNYFILDSEKASNERTMLKDYGYKQLHNALWHVFPYLSMNESLQDMSMNEGRQDKATINPLWVLADNIANDSESCRLLNGYAGAFKASRKLDLQLPPTDEPQESLGNLLKLAVAQFARGETRHNLNATYVRAIIAELCSHFIQSRGRAGRVQVFNQDHLILLTNLAIGEQDKLRFHELIKAFQTRGVFFDKQSQQVLIEFYERIGNVERMSDSGDAVYVSKTI